MTSAQETCAKCHASIVDAATKAEYRHTSLEHGCQTCHAPHTAADPSLLNAPERELCGKCHADEADPAKNRGSSHHDAFDGNACAQCHAVHGSDVPGMLKVSQRDLCLKCHGTAKVAADGRTIESVEALEAGRFTHGSQNQSQCGNCHAMHAANPAGTSHAVSRRVPVGSYDQQNYSLCFGCHDAAMMQGSNTTQFRDADRNLHELHVAGGPTGERSRGCAACHGAHTTPNPRLISGAAGYEGSAWKSPMTFALEGQGGRCGPSCHEPQRYSREPGGARAPNQGGAR